MQVHGTTVTLNGKGLLILGPSGSGKSTLALQLMAVGAQLVADDRTDLVKDGGDIVAHCPETILGQIEARGLGILAAMPGQPARLAAIVDLGRESVDRMPRSQFHDILGVALPLVLGPYRPHLYAALRQLLIGGMMTQGKSA